MNLLLSLFILCSTAMCATDIVPMQVRKVSLRKVSLNTGERIISMEVQVGKAKLTSIRFPKNWTYEVATVAPGILTLHAETVQTIGEWFDPELFHQFLIVAFAEEDRSQFSISVKLG